MVKPFWKSKTLWFNILSVVAMIVQYLVDNQMFTAYAKWELLAIAVINFVLRLLTNQGIGTPKNNS